MPLNVYCGIQVHVPQPTVTTFALPSSVWFLFYDLPSPTVLQEVVFDRAVCHFEVKFENVGYQIYMADKDIR